MIFTSVQQLAGQLFNVAGVALAGCVCWQSHRAWQRGQVLQDLSALVLAVTCLVYFVITLPLNQLGAQHAAGSVISAFTERIYSERVCLQLLALALGCFLLLTVSIHQRWVYATLAVQAIFGVMVLTLSGIDAGKNLAAANAYLLWILTNLCGACVVTAVIFQAALRLRSTAGWLAFTGCLMGFSLFAEQLLTTEQRFPSGMTSQLTYALVLWVMWRATSAENGNDAQRSDPSVAFPHSTTMALLSEFEPLSDTAAASAVAVAQERRRIGQDLHDGVASQLVTLLSTLDSASPHDQRMALALEKCLVDLKMTVDVLDASSDNVLDLLGRLRYRIQHSLDKLGIQMFWRVQVREELAAVRGEAALHTLRIAQESLSNVMVHAHASAVEVVCRYVGETGMLLLEIRDNGRGIDRRTDGGLGRGGASGAAATRLSGKGLINMRNRAKSVGGKLTISSKLGAGTRVRLQLPLVPTPEHPVV